MTLVDIELTRNDLATVLIGKKIVKVFAAKNYWVKVDKFQSSIVTDILRNGNYIILKSATDIYIKFVYSTKIYLTTNKITEDSVEYKETPIFANCVITLNDILHDKPYYLAIVDNSFGNVTVGCTPPKYSELGYDIFNMNFTKFYLQKRCINSNSETLKEALLNIKVIVYLDNDYLCEALFLANIYPFKKIKDITLDEYGCLVKSLKEVYNRALDHVYYNSNANPVPLKELHTIYEAKDCYVCGGEIMNKVVNDLPTYFCKGCQT